MSSVYRPQDDYRNWYALGSTVEFDAPEGGRLIGEIVRLYPNPTAIHVLVGGIRYEVDIRDDNATMIWE